MMSKRKRGERRDDEVRSKLLVIEADDGDVGVGGNQHATEDAEGTQCGKKTRLVISAEKSDKVELVEGLISSNQCANGFKLASSQAVVVQRQRRAPLRAARRSSPSQQPVPHHHRTHCQLPNECPCLVSDPGRDVDDLGRPERPHAAGKCEGSTAWWCQVP